MLIITGDLMTRQWWGRGRERELWSLMATGIDDMSMVIIDSYASDSNTTAKLSRTA